MFKQFQRTLLINAAALAIGLFLVSAVQAKKPPKPGDEDPPSDPPAVEYSISLLGTLGGSSSVADAMNESGDVVGTSETADGGVKPFVYLKDTGTIHDLYDLFTAEDRQRWTSWWPYGINSLGQICGSAYKQNDAGEYEELAVRFTPAYTDTMGNVVAARVDIVGLSGAESDINEFGDVTGGYSIDGVWRSFLYTDEDGLQDDIGDLGGGGTSASAINNFGQITGSSRNVDGDLRAFRYTPDFGMEDLGVIKEDRSGGFSVGEDINDDGVVIGRSSAKAGSAHVFRDAGQGLEDLGTLGGNACRPFSVNSKGDIVGWTTDKSGQIQYFLYTDELGMVKLESLITNLPPSTDKIRAVGINDAGDICGTISFTDGTEEAFLLTLEPND